MTLEVQEFDEGFRLLGELDIATEKVLTEALSSKVRPGEDLVLDLAGLAFIDSGGVRAILRAAGQVGESGKLHLLDPGPAVQRVLDLMRLDSIPNVHVTRSQEPPS